MANFVPQIDYTSRDYASIREDLINLIPLYAPKWTSRDSADFGIILLELFAYMGDLLNYYIDRAANESFLSTASQRDSVLRIAQLLGYTPTDSISATTTLTFYNSTASTIVVPAGTQVGTTTVVNGVTTQVVFETDSAVTVPAAVGSTQGQINVSATEGETISNELVGNSDGTSDQEFILSESPVINNTIEVVVNDTVYLSVPYLIDASGTDAVFYSSTDSEEVTSVVFGDGVSGRIPPANSQIYVTYKIGGGVRGNVTAGSLTTILTNFVPGLTVTNANAASGGADAESTDSIRVNAPASIRTSNRAVSLKDYGDLAVQVTGVAKAVATSEVYTNVNLYIAPYGDPGVDGSGNLTQVFNQLTSRIQEFFVEKIPPNVTITLFPPDFVSINVTILINALPQYKQSAVQRNVEKAIQEILSFDNVSFADEITRHYITQAVAAAAGVSYSNVTLLARSDASQTGVTDILLDINEIPKAGTITVQVTGGISG